MIVKEKTPPQTENHLKKEKISDKKAFSIKWTAALLCGMLFCVGQGFMPICTALTAALPTMLSAAVFSGVAICTFALGKIEEMTAELISMAIILTLRLIMGKFTEKVLKSAAVGFFSAAVYTFSGLVQAFYTELSPVIAAAVLFRGIICGITAYFISCEIDHIKQTGRISVSGMDSLCTAALYVTAISALFNVTAGNLSIGRCFGGFVILAAGGRFGGAGGAVVGILTSLGAILGSTDGDISEFPRSMAVISCSGLIAGTLSKYGKLSSSAAFTLISLFLTLFMGRLSWAASLMTDTLIAAALYALIPDRFYMKLINTAIAHRSAAAEHLSRSIAFGAACFSAAGNSTNKAAELLAEKNYIRTDISTEVCEKICGECRNHDFCCRDDENRIKSAFIPCERLLLSKGFITAAELPRCIDSCTKKDALADFMNKLYTRKSAFMQKNDLLVHFREKSSAQFSSSADFISDLGRKCSDDKIYDEGMSERAAVLIGRYGAENVCAAVFFDKSGYVFISAFFSGKLNDTISELTEKLSALTDRDLEEPEFFSEDCTVHACWHEAYTFNAETGKAIMCGREKISGDSCIQFSDGLGSVYFIIADGMGSGNRASVESSMACSLLSRLIRAGAGEGSALRLVNSLLSTKASDEVFTTVDMLKINLFSGKASFYKAGAVKSFVKTGGSVSSVECTSFPLGIFPDIDVKPVTLRLSDGASVALFSDGIPESCYPKLRELLLSDGYSPSRCADTIIELDKDELFPDDRTIFVLKLHKL